jgi:transketolase
LCFLNGLQGFGSTKEVADIGELADRFRGLPLDVVSIDGHNPEAIEAALRLVSPDRAVAVVASTVKGHGVSFMENQMAWHYLPMTAEQYLQAAEELGRL